MIFYLRFRDMKMFEYPLMYALMVAERVECHGMAFMFMWHYRNAHMTAHQLWILTRQHRNTFCTSSLTDMTFSDESTFLWCMSPPVMPSTSFFSIHSLGLKVNPIGYLLCSGSLWMFSPRRCYLLPTDRAMNSGPKWNSYCYQKHKIPITLGVRSRDKKMKQVLIKAAGVINQRQGPGKKRRLIK